MRALICLGILFIVFAGCANRDGSARRTKLVVENVYSPQLHSADCKEGLQLKVTVRGRSHETPLIPNAQSWDYELFQEKSSIPYTLHVTCYSLDGSRTVATHSGAIPGKDEQTVLSGIVIGPPRIEPQQVCANVASGQPCVQYEN